MKFALILNVLDEGPDVHWTINSFREARGKHDFCAVVVGDGTSDGSLDEFEDSEDVLIVRPNERIGIGEAKHLAVQQAQKVFKPDWVWHNDGHNRCLTPGAADIIGELVMERRCIVTPALGPLGCENDKTCKDHGDRKICQITCPRYKDRLAIPSNCYFGGKLSMTGRDDSPGLCVINTTSRPRDAIAETDAVNPSCFAYSIKTLAAFGGWNRYPGWWGSQELGLSLRAWFSATPVLIARDVICLHRYRSWNHPQGRAIAPYEIPGGHRGANERYATRVVFSPDTWRAVWVPFFERFRTDEKAVELFQGSRVEAQRRTFAKKKKRTDAEFFEHVGYPNLAEWKASPKARRSAYYLGGGLGNALMCLPAIRALYELGGNEPVDIVGKKLHQDGTRELLGQQPYIRKVVDTIPIADLPDYRRVVGSYWASAPAFLPCGTETAAVPKSWRTRHEVECNVQAIRELGFTGPMPPATLGRWPQVNEIGESMVAVGVGCAGYKSKKYPHWRMVCERLARAGVPLVFVGTAEDDAPWMDSLGKNLCGKTSIYEASGVLWGCRLYVGIDNGLSHLANAVGTPGILLYGPSSERKNAPWGSGNRILRSSAFDCAPCWDHPRADKCPDTVIGAGKFRPCMIGLQPEYVTGEIFSVLNAPAWSSGATWPLYLTKKQDVENLIGNAQQCHEEFSELAGLLRRMDIMSVVEIGSGTGAWLGIVCGMLNRPIRVLAIESHPHHPQSADGSICLGKMLDKLKANGHDVTWFKTSSDSVVHDAKNWSAGGVDLLHIDGDHSLLQVARDFENYSPLVRSGGLIVFQHVGDWQNTEAGPGAVFSGLARETGWRSWKFFYGKGDPHGIGIGVLQIPRKESVNI